MKRQKRVLSQLRILCSHSSLFLIVYEGCSARPTLNMWESTQMKGIQEWNDCWGLSGGDPVKAQKQLWAEISPNKVGWGQGSLDAAPQAGWKFREVFLLTHGSHFSLQPACGSPFSSSCQQELCLPVAPVTMWSSLQAQHDLTLTFLLSFSLCLSQIPLL